VEINAFKPFIEGGALIQSSSGRYTVRWNIMPGSSGGVGTAFDPWDEKSLASARKYMNMVYDQSVHFAASAIPIAAP
jgi:hypothetical protein